MRAETVVDAPARLSTRQHTRGTGGNIGCACDFRSWVCVLLALRVFGFWRLRHALRSFGTEFYGAENRPLHQTVSPRATFISFRNVVAAPRYPDGR